MHLPFMFSDTLVASSIFYKVDLCKVYGRNIIWKFEGNFTLNWEGKITISIGKLTSLFMLFNKMSTNLCQLFIFNGPKGPNIIVPFDKNGRSRFQSGQIIESQCMSK